MSDVIYSRGRATVTETGGVIGLGPFKRMSWGAVFAGLFIVTAIQFLFSLLGFGVGLHLVQPGGGPEAQTIGIGAVIWWVVTYLIALIVGCYAAAWLAGAADGFDGALHGVVTWALALAVSLFVMTTAVGGLVGGTLGLVGNTLQSAAPALAGAAMGSNGQQTSDQMQNFAQDLLQRNDSANLSPQDARNELIGDMRRYMAGGDQAQAAHDHMVGIIASQLNISRDEAAQRVDQWDAKVQQAKKDAAQAAERAAHIAAQASLWGFVGLVLGAIFAALGGMWGAQQLAREQTQEVYR